MDDKQLQQKLARLQGEILLAEKKLRILQEDIERHQQSKGKAFQEFDMQIKKKKEELKTLMDEGQRVASVTRLYTQSYEDLLRKTEELKVQYDTDFKKARDAVQDVHDSAVRRERAVTDREENIIKQAAEIVSREQVFTEKMKIVKWIQDDNEKKIHDLELREQEFLRTQDMVNNTLAKQREVLDDINRQISQKAVEIVSLDTMIKQKTTQAESIGEETQKRLAAVKLREIQVAGKEQELDEKAKRLYQKELWLADRERTVGRAYRETVQRGGKIN